MSRLNALAAIPAGFFKGFWKHLGILFFIMALPWFVYVLFDDLAHPERWERNWMHNPRIYMPMFVIVMFLGMALFMKASLDYKRMKR